MKTIHAVDLFCGAGGASVGLRRACEALGLNLDLLAINHWPIAVQTHMLNHPGVRHICESVERVNPRDAVPGGRLHLLMPEVDGRRLDIRFRMLQPHELAAAMGFGADYAFIGTKGAQVKQIGNAWACGVAEALCTATLQRYEQAAHEIAAPRRLIA